MSEKPILMKGWGVRATIAGTKTQTRRVIKPQPNTPGEGWIADWYNHSDAMAFWRGLRMSEPRTWKCPYGKPGDVLWVRETWAHDSGANPCDVKACGIPAHIYYRATEAMADTFAGEAHWRPSIHMPRWACRLELTIKSIRVERVQDISEEDAIAEGIDSAFIDAGTPLQMVEKFIAPGVEMTNIYGDKDMYAPAHCSPRAAFSCLWDSINAKRGYGWDTNPWVWVIEYEVKS